MSSRNQSSTSLDLPHPKVCHSSLPSPSLSFPFILTSLSLSLPLFNILSSHHLLYLLFASTRFLISIFCLFFFFFLFLFFFFGLYPSLSPQYSPLSLFISSVAPRAVLYSLVVLLDLDHRMAIPSLISPHPPSPLLPLSLS